MARKQLAYRTANWSFARDGFAPIANLATRADLGLLSATCDLLRRETTSPRRGLMGSGDGDGELLQLLHPERAVPEILDTDFVRSGMDLGQRLLPNTALDWFTHAIIKPARVGLHTPWHQDVAYDPVLHRPGCSIWLALDDATPASGCLRFVPGSHHGPILDHELADRTPGAEGLEAIGVDIDEWIDLPAKAGDGSVHNHRTLHGAGPNTSDRARIGFVLVGIAQHAPDRPKGRLEPLSRSPTLGDTAHGGASGGTVV